jgi:hypothetical protein
LKTQEMIRILEELILDPETNATAKCTAIRTLREIQAEHPPERPSAFRQLYEVRPNGGDGDLAS